MIPAATIYAKVRTALAKGEVARNGKEFHGRIVYQRKNAKAPVVGSLAPQAFIVTQVTADNLKDRMADLAA